MDQYPDVTVNWKLHERPVLHVYDTQGIEVKTVDLSQFDHEKLHVLFSAHFRREDVDPPGILVRTWRRLFGWAYGISTLESTLLFVFSGCVLALGCYTICFRYTQCCDAISDL